MLFRSESKNQNVEIIYKQGKSNATTISIKPNTSIISGQRAIGLGLDEIGILKLPIHFALLEGAKTTWLLTKGTATGLAKFFWDTIRFKSDFSQVSGPIGIASVVGQATNLGFVYLLSLVALISINLAIINLIPFPALDGGRLLFVLIEAIIGRPISPSTVKWTNTIGFAFLLVLMVLVTSHDIFKLL